MNNSQKIMNHVTIAIEPGEAVDEALLMAQIQMFSAMYPVSEKEKQELLASLHAKLAIRMDTGASIRDKNHVTWYYSAKKESKTEFWERYMLYLMREVGFSPDVVNALDAQTDEMMDLLGNPANTLDFQRRGLVIGDVQSGKTATYTALINKAADSNYKVIILLTGTIEKLRKQTQGRMDEGFIGLDSTAYIRDKNNVHVGVGVIDPSISGLALTSTTSDFNKDTAAKLNVKLSGIKDPVIFVVKKNKSGLEKLEQWLRIYNANPATQKINLPMLLIDDEADNASVNTKGVDDPAAINVCIRMLLKLFSKANYVGFTATPFANIFINPDTVHEMLEDDLFPKDFIYALEAPTNYVGARSIYAEGGKHAFMLKNNDDCEEYLPEKHKLSIVVKELPESMKQAIASFFICNAVRDLRGKPTSHRSMLINVSRFIAVQEQLLQAIDGYVRDMQRQIKSYHLIGEDALKYDVFAFMKSVFDTEFANIPNFEFSWPEIQAALHKAGAAIEVRTVNGGNASKNLNYDEYTDEGLRLIAIGGLSLSRGLTLEGLCVSYFYRNSKMYDTLMQMGRWFGYREGYADICQVWMSEEAVDWYRYISEASDELRREVRRMKSQNRTPMEYGLSVRSDINTLLVTARNKMRSATDYSMTISMNGKVVETKYVSMIKEQLDVNYNNTVNWLNGLQKMGYGVSSGGDLALQNKQFLNIPKAIICDLLAGYTSHPLNMSFQSEDIIRIINDFDDNTVDLWDVVIASGKGEEEVTLGSIKVKPVKRNFGIKNDSKALQMSGSGSRLGSKDLAKGGLTREQVERIVQRNNGDKSLSQDAYFNSGETRKPLLVIYPVELSPDPKVPAKLEEKVEIARQLPTPIIGLAIGVPSIDGKPHKTYNYKITMQKYKELFGIDTTENFEEEILQEEDSNV